MQFPRSLLLALVSAPFMVYAQNPNPFKIPSSGLSATAGQAVTLSWNPTTQGTVSLILRSGSSNDLAAGTTIASSIANSGSYTWTPAAMLTRGSDYTVEIVDDSDPSQTNYTPYFVLDSDNTVAYSTSQVTLGAQSTTSALSTASATGSAAALLSSISSSVAAVSSHTSATATGASSMGSISSSASASSANGGVMTTGSSSSTSGSAASASASASTMATTTNSGAGFVSTGSSSASVAAQSQAGAPRATAMAGMMGLVALGALAL